MFSCRTAWPGADPEYSLPIRIITQKAWHSLFARTMFLKVRGEDALRRHVPEFTVIAAPGFQASPMVDGTRSETFIIINFRERLAIIGGTNYAGEIKKTIFTVLNFLLPLQGVLSMHCSANVGADGDVAIFFGLSGTGKTTLSADPKRHLIGDDEHGWSDNGVFNFEDGCYAKVIRLSEDAEPQIYACTRRFGTVLENVTFDPVSRRLDLNDYTVTENTRAAYPLSYIANHQPEKRAGHPQNVIFLTCDASGVMPPISKLSPDQAIYHFISGYTSKIAGTEVGLGVEPEMTFSTCFGGPFMVHHPLAYAELLKQKIQEARRARMAGEHRLDWRTVWHRQAHQHSIHARAAERRAQRIATQGGYKKDPVFGFDVPTECEGVPSQILDPANTWPSRDQYFDKYDALAARFIENFKLMMSECPEHMLEAGPKRLATAAIR